MTEWEWENLHSLHQLKELYFTEERLGQSWKFPSASLTRLSLHECLIEEGALDSLKRLSNLVELDLRSTRTINPDDNDEENPIEFSDLCVYENDTIQCHLTRLLSLKVAYPFKDRRTLSILSSLVQLNDLTLYCENWRGEGAPGIDPKLFNFIPKSTTSLDLQNVSLDEECTIALSSCVKIRKLKIDCPDLTISQTKQICLMEGLEKLDLSDKSIGGSILEEIATIKTLRQFEFRPHTLADARIDILSQMTHLEKLAIHWRGKNRDQFEQALSPMKMTTKVLFV